MNGEVHCRQWLLAGVFNMLGYLDEGLGDLDDSLLIQLIVASGLWLWATL